MLFTIKIGDNYLVLLYSCHRLWGRKAHHPVSPQSPPPMKGKHMNKYKVTILYCDGRVKDVEVQGTDGPEFNGDNGMYKHLDCSRIEITGARYKWFVYWWRR